MLVAPLVFCSPPGPSQSTERGRKSSKHFQRFLLRRLDGENLVQPRDLDQLHQLFTDAAEDEFAVRQRDELFVHRQHDADRLRREVLNLSKSRMILRLSSASTR